MPGDERKTFTLSANGALTVGAGKDRWIAPFSGEIINATAVVGTAPTGAAAIFDIDKDGTTVFTTQANRPTIPDGASESPVSARPDVTTFAAGDVLSLGVDQVGSTVAGSDADVVVQYLND